MKLNLCCGDVISRSYINIDMEPSVKPDLVLDIRKEKLPYENKSIEEVRIFHGIEHIERKYWDFVFMEASRVLLDNGLLVLGYPEFSICVDNFFKNKDNIQNFWMECLYGRQQYPGDYHVTLVHSPELRMILESYGFYRIQTDIESPQDYYYSVTVAKKDPAPQCREVVLGDQVGLKDSVSIESVDAFPHA